MEKKNNNRDKNLERIKVLAEARYAKFGKCPCPYFDDLVSFNNKGITHIKFKRDKIARDRKDQYMRLKNIHLAPLVLKKSHTLQDYFEKNEMVKVRVNKRKEMMLKRVYYFGFLAIVNDSGMSKRLKVIVKQVEGGDKYFYSIIPFWKNNKELKLHSGDMIQD